MSTNIRGKSTSAPPSSGVECRVVLTWDDGPTEMAALTIAELADNAGVPIEFYWCGANLLRKEVRDSLGIRYSHGTPMTAEGRPLAWLQWLDQHRGSRSPEDYLSTVVDPRVREVGRQLHAGWGAGRLSTRIGYHGITHDLPDTPAHPARLSERALVAELRFFELLMRVACDAPEFELRIGRTPYGSGLRLPYHSPVRRHEECWDALQRAGQLFHPAFVWHGWDADTKDYFYDGSFEEGEIVAGAVERAVRLSLPQVRLLMHERCYVSRPHRVERILTQVRAQTARLSGTGPVEALPVTWDGFRPGPCWSYDRAGELLRRGSLIEPRGERLAVYARAFLELNAPFAHRASDQDEAPGLTFERFDGLSFVWTLLSMTASTTLEECASKYARLRHPVELMRRGSLSPAAVLQHLEAGVFIQDVTRGSWTAAGLDDEELVRVQFNRCSIGDTGTEGRRALEVSPAVPFDQLYRMSSVLACGDVLLLLDHRRDEDAVGISHAIVLLTRREEQVGTLLVAHADSTPLERPDGRLAGVSFASRAISKMPRIEEDAAVGIDLSTFALENAGRWRAAFVLRAG